MQDKAELFNSEEKIQVLILELVTFIFICIMMIDTLRSYNRILNM